jgi:hypothetical protein
MLPIQIGLRQFSCCLKSVFYFSDVQPDPSLVFLVEMFKVLSQQAEGMFRSYCYWALPTHNENLKSVLHNVEHAVAQLVEVLCYKPDGRLFDPR